MLQVTDLIYRGPRPESVDWLLDKGFRRVINLESGIFRFFHGSAYENTLNETFAILEKNFPMSDVLSPRIHTLNVICLLLNRFEIAGLKTYVHCLHGEDRTGMVIAAYRIKNCCWTVEHAVNEMYTNGFHRIPYQFWVPTLYEFDLT